MCSRLEPTEQPTDRSVVRAILAVFYYQTDGTGEREKWKWGQKTEKIVKQQTQK